MLDITQHWYRKSLSYLTLLLLPFSWLYRLILALRSWLYRLGVLRTHQFAIPVIVVGNITVGGTGKTPLVIWLAHFLRSQGYHPGIVTRGYGGKRHKTPKRVLPDSVVKQVGDEAILLARSTGCPTVVCIDRVAAVKSLIKNSSCDIVLSDDGLQHYRLGRALEIAIVDNARQFGNNQLLPAGPLREPRTRLKKVDFFVTHMARELGDEGYTMILEPLELVSLKTNTLCKLKEFAHKTIHAIAGIGHPERFFATLRAAGFTVIAHPFPDHYHFEAKDLVFNDDYPLVLTEKDAVKCQEFANSRFWYMRVAAKMDDKFVHDLTAWLQEVGGASENSSYRHAFLQRPLMGSGKSKL